MKNKTAVKTIERSLGGIIRFFLFIPPVFNLIGNFIGLTQQYTFYAFGFNGVAILSRFVENSIANLTWRTIVLVLVTFVATAFCFGLLRLARRNKVTLFIILFTLYSLDTALMFSNYYLESLFDFSISSFIHFFTLIVLLVFGLFTIFLSPIKKGYYDHA